MPLPTERFLRAASGRVLDVGAGSGRAAWRADRQAARHGDRRRHLQRLLGNDGNTPERFMANARIAGVADRASARVGDMRQLPFGDADSTPWSARRSARLMALPHIPDQDLSVLLRAPTLANTSALMREGNSNSSVCRNRLLRGVDAIATAGQSR